MRQRWQWILGGLAIFAVGFYAGGFFGAHRAMMVIEPVMRSEVAASIGFEIDELIFLRTGNPDKALRRMEWRLDAAILGVAGVRPSQELSTGDRQALQLAAQQVNLLEVAAALHLLGDQRAELLGCLPIAAEVLSTRAHETDEKVRPAWVERRVRDD